MASRALFKVPELHSPFDRRAFPIYGLIVALGLVGALLLAILGFTVSLSVWMRFVSWPLLTIAGGLGLRRIGHPNFGGAMEATGILYWQGLSSFLCLVPLASISAPFADWRLAAADRALGFDWVGYAKATSGFETLFVLSYKSFMWQPALAAFALFLSKQPDRGWRLVFAATIALAITAIAFPFAPAIGASEFYHFKPWTHVEQFAPILLALKSGHRVLDSSTFAGIVSFPSYHAAAAAIFAWGCWTTKVRWPMLILNALMCLGAITLGSHYLIDVLAGLAIGACSIFLAGRILAALGHRSPKGPVRFTAIIPT